jgi:hypothetical protein
VTLSWDERAYNVYRLTRESFHREMKLDIDAMLANPEVMQTMITELKSLEPESKRFPIRLTLEGDNAYRIEVLAKNAKMAHNAEAVDENERLLREMQKKTEGLVQLNTVIDHHGENLHPYLKNGQSNLLTMLFRLPDHPVRVGEHWRLPLQVLTSLNTPFLADRTHRDNQVWINAVTERPGIGKVAEIVYLLREEIEGKKQMFVQDTPESFKSSSSYFAVAEFAVDEHRWLRYVGRLDSTVDFIRTVHLIALMPAGEPNR